MIVVSNQESAWAWSESSRCPYLHKASIECVDGLKRFWICDRIEARTKSKHITTYLAKANVATFQSPIRIYSTPSKIGVIGRKWFKNFAETLLYRARHTTEARQNTENSSSSSKRVGAKKRHLIDQFDVFVSNIPFLSGG